MPATSTSLNRLLFLLQLLTVLMKQKRQAVRAVKQSIYLDVYARNAYLMFGGMEKGNSIKMGGERDSGNDVRNLFLSIFLNFCIIS